MAYNILNESFVKIYSMYLDKIEKKGRTKEELNAVIYWLTGFSENGLNKQLTEKVSVGEFFNSFPKINENAHLIRGSICGYKIEEIQDPLMKRIRFLDKLVDELAKGRPLDKVLRKD